MADQSIEAGADALVVDPDQDHVATALQDLQAGAMIRLRLGAETGKIKLLQDIPFGHKLAIRGIKRGEEVRKYGEVIGRAVSDIEPGEHVHVHNIEGIRGRGDQAEGGEEHVAD